jgi:alanyl-tRNA synthetase
MTIRRYFDSDALTLDTEVLACEPDDDGHFRVRLAATPFHPQGGGQPSDTGRIGAARVLHVAVDGEAIVHRTDRAVTPGAVSVEVDAAPRALHARLHSAGHLIGYAGATSGWRAVKGHHWPGEARVVFEPDEGARPIEAEAFAREVDAVVAAALPRTMRIHDGMRVIGFGEFEAYGCGGTHVASSEQVGRIVIVKLKEKKGQLTVQYEVA